MANGRIRFGKQSGGELALVFPDGATNTEVTFPESGILTTKDYADLKVALADFTGTNANLATTGYQKLPSGLIIQWGHLISQANIRVSVNLPIAFPNSALSSYASHSNNTAPAGYCDVHITTTQVGIRATNDNAYYSYLAIGY